MLDQVHGQDSAIGSPSLREGKLFGSLLLSCSTEGARGKEKATTIMKDEKEANREFIENLWTRFEEELSQDKFAVCDEIVYAAGDAGFENDAIKMGHKVNVARIEALCRKQKTCIAEDRCRLNHKSIQECIAWEEKVGLPEYDSNAPGRGDEIF